MLVGSTMGHVMGMPDGAAWLPAPGVNVFSMPLTAHDATGQPVQVSTTPCYESPCMFILVAGSDHKGLHDSLPQL